MADVILFSPRRQPASTRPSDPETASAQIMFFTGVRYQRMTEAASLDGGGGRPTTAGGGVGKRKRKRG